MKIIVAGIYRYPMYQEALASGLEAINQDVHRVVLLNGHSWDQCVAYKNSKIVKQAVDEIKPDCLFLYRAEIIFAGVLRYLKHRYPQMKIFIYHNDDPFRKTLHRRLKSFHYLRCVKYADITYVYRKVNLAEAQKWGAKKTALFMSHFYSKKDLIELSDDSFLKNNDRIVYIGHYENDSRIEIIDYLYKHNINLDIYSNTFFEKAFEKHGWPKEHYFENVYEEEYRKTISESAMALAFFSTANRDEYTRRCFEIPIMGTLLLAPRTVITEQIFRDGENAILYNSPEDLYEKIVYLNSHKEIRNKIAKEGYEFMKGSNHSEIARAKMVVEDYIKLLK